MFSERISPVEEQRTLTGIDLGQDVYSSDNEKIGKIDRLVLNSENQHVEELVVHQGFLSADKLIDLDLVDRVDGDRVILSLPVDQAEGLPAFVEKQYVSPSNEGLGIGSGVPLGNPNGGRILYAGPMLTPAYPGGTGSFFDPPVAATAVVENVDNLPEQDVMVGGGSDVVGADGTKIGSVDRVITGAGGGIAEIVVKAGFIFKHDVTIPGSWVGEIDDDRIVLTVTADEARARGER